jgi:hypothetical protein
MNRTILGHGVRLSLAALLLWSSSASAAVLCARAKADGTFSTTLKIRESCTATETQLDPDALGLRGPAGPAGLTGIETVSAEHAAENVGPGYPDVAWGSVFCPSGKAVIGGGAMIRSNNNATPPQIALMASVPVGDVGWYGIGREMVPATSDWKLIVWARCATVGN